MAQSTPLSGALIQWAFVQYQPQNLSGDLLQWGFVQKQTLAGSLVDFAFTQQTALSGNLIGLGFAQTHRLSGSLLQYGFAQNHARARRRFKGSQTQGFGDFDIAVYIGGVAVNMCEFAQSMTISHGENESYLCSFVIRPRRDRKLPREMDLYRWYAQPIVIQAVSNRERVQLYQGIVDSVDYAMMQGVLTIQCSDRREQQINALPHSTIAAIGYTCKAAHGNQFDTQKDELDKRLTTVPASFEFDANGTPYLTAWKPKDVPDVVLSPCVIYLREPKLSLASVGGVTNAVDVEVSLQHTRLLQRSHVIHINLNIGVCEYAKFGQLPDLDEINSAVNETGWTMWGYNLERVARTGWYNCDGRQMAWYRDGNARQYDGDKLVSKSKRFNSDVVAGSIEAIKRWTQTIAQTIKIRVENRASINRYQEVKQGISYTVNVDAPEGLNWDSADNPHADRVQYEQSSQNTLYYPFFKQGNLPRIPHARFQAADNGDWYADFDDSGGEWARTLQVAYHTAYTLILAAHRQNTVELEVKFMPHIDLRHTHEIQHPLFHGKAKVSHFTHSFNFETKLGQTTVQYRFFQNAEDNGQYTPFRQPENPAQTFPRYTNRSSVGKVLLPKGGEDEIAGSMMGGSLEIGMERYRYGMIYQQVNGAKINGKEQEKYQARVLRFKTPDIEEASTATRTLERKLTYAVNVYNDAVRVRI